jgi:hypothetical protein
MVCNTRNLQALHLLENTVQHAPLGPAIHACINGVLVSCHGNNFTKNTNLMKTDA